MSDSNTKSNAEGYRAGNDRLTAIEHHARACRQDPNDIKARLALAGLYLETGNIHQARDLLHQADALKPGDTATLQRLAGLLLAAGLYQSCIRSCRRLLELAGDSAAAYSLAGTALQLQGNLDEAARALKQAVLLAPGNATHCYKYACVLHALGDSGQALRHFEAARKYAPDFGEALGGLARIHIQQGNIDALGKLVEPLLEAARRSPLVLPTLASIAARFGIVQQTIEITNAHLASERLSDRARNRLHWSLGTLYESLGEYARAFQHHSLGKSAAARIYDAQANSAFADRTIRVFTRDRLACAPSSSADSAKPVFIVGMPRSGTTLVEQILASHSAVHGAGELPHISWLASAIARLTPSGSPYPEGATELAKQQLDEYAEQYLGVLDRLAPHAQRVTDKMPHNYRFLGLVQQLFPHSRIIHVKRDPLDTCLSCYFQEFSAAHAYTQTLHDLGQHYLDYTRLMQHWISTLAIPLLTIRYEELVRNPESVSRRMIEFCELEWEEQCLEFHASGRSVLTLSAEQVTRPVYTGSIGRWRSYAKQLDELRKILQQDGAG